VVISGPSLGIGSTTKKNSKFYLDIYLHFPKERNNPLYIFFFKKTMDKNDHIYESASEALHIVQFESFVKSMTSCLSKLKVTPGFCFPNTILDFVQCKPIPVMKTGFSLGSFSRWEKTCFYYREPCFHYRDGFAVYLHDIQDIQNSIFGF
jgi:hypothetical protein